MHGCNGRMGQMITSLAAEDKDIEIVAGIDISDHISNPYPVFSKLSECDVEADVVVDFASVKVIDELLDVCVEKNLPVVVCTTGLSEEQVQKVHETSKHIPVLRSANMSLGINVIQDVLTKISELLSTSGFDIEIVEKHHKMKKDAPSGTALALADAVNAGLAEKKDYIYDRSDRLEARGDNELGISAVRGGTIVGEHEVIFAGTDEVITIKHTAYSRAIFGKGALSAAKFLATAKPGMYDMNAVVSK